MKKRRLLILPAGIIFIFLAVAVTRFFTERAYREQLPENPEKISVDPLVYEQITSEHRKTQRNPSAENIGNLGRVYHSNALYEEASKCYLLAIERGGGKWIWNYYLGYLKQELGESENAIGYFREAIRDKPDAFMAYYYAGEAFGIIGLTDSSEKYLQKIAGLEEHIFDLTQTSRTNYFPLPVYAKFELARIYAGISRLEESEELLEEILSNHKSFGPAYRQLSSLYKIKGDSAMSRYYSTRANDLHIYTPPPDTLVDELVMLTRSEVFLLKQIDNATRSANSKLAVDLIIHGLQYMPDNKYLISRAIKQFTQTGLGNRALPYIQAHVGYFGNDIGELIETGSYLADAGFKKEARLYFLRARDQGSNDPDFATGLASLMFEKAGMKEEAVKQATSQIEKEPDNHEILYKGISLFLEMDEKELAEYYLTRLRKLEPSFNKLKVIESTIIFKGGDREKAAPILEEAFKTDPSDRKVIDMLGDIFLKEKMWGKAIKFLRSVLAVYPNDSYYQVSLGSLLVTCPDPVLRNITEGKEYCERAYYNKVYTLSTKISAGRNLAIAYNELGDRRKAGYYITETLELAMKAGISEDYLRNLEALAQEFLSE